MKPLRYLSCSLIALAAFGFAATSSAAPTVNSVVINERLFNNCPTSELSVIDDDLAGVVISDANLDCFGFANRHSWTFSADNVNPVEFHNNDQFTFCATISTFGSGNGEAGLRLSPWWSPEIDGTFMLNTASGEIAVFGGRLPFYSFTGAHGQTYVKGTSVILSMSYDPNSLTEADPATIVYTLTNSNGTFSSPPLTFDQGNPAEDPPHGQWGILQPSRAGGYIQAYLGQGEPVSFGAVWKNICYDAPPTPATPATWGRIKAEYR
jgi:hypothetical protein